MKKFKSKFLLPFLFLLATGTKAIATEWTTYVCYYADTSDNVVYLRPEVHYECLSFSIEYQAQSIMACLVEYNPVFDYQQLKEKEGNFYVFLKTNELSKIEQQELITSLLMNGFCYVTVVYPNGTGIKYSKEDIVMPFFLPVYFRDQSLCNERFINNASEMIQCAEANDDEKESSYDDENSSDKHDNEITHHVRAGETIYGITKQYAISQNELIENNPEIKNSPLQIGQELIIHRKYGDPSIIFSNRNNYEDYEDYENYEESEKNENQNIALYILLGMSVLANGWLIWKLKTS